MSQLLGMCWFETVRCSLVYFDVVICIFHSFCILSSFNACLSRLLHFSLTPIPPVLILPQLSRHLANEPSCVCTSSSHLLKLTRVSQEEVCSTVILIIPHASQNHTSLFLIFHHIAITKSLVVIKCCLTSSLMESLLTILICKSEWRDIWNCWKALKIPFMNFKPLYGLINI